MRLWALLILSFALPVCAWAQSAPDAVFCAGSAGTDDDRIAACTRAITAGKLSTADLAITFYNRGNAWHAKGDNDRAIADYTEAIRLDPREARAFNNRAVAWQAKGEYDRAIADCNEAIRLDPQEAYFFNTRGTSWYAKGDTNRAIADYSEAIRLDPREVDAFLNRGIAKFFKGPFDAAAADFSEAIRLEATDAYAYIWRYLSRARGGNANAAREELLAGAPRLDKGTWPAPVIDLLLGRVDPGALLPAAKSPDAETARGQVCEAHFYLGEFYLVAGQPTLARANLVDAARGCRKDYLEYSAAVAELTRLPR